MLREQISNQLKKILKDIEVTIDNISVEIPSDSSHGDYTTNVAFAASKLLKKSPLEIAEKIADALGREQKSLLPTFDKIEAVSGFINFYLSKEYLEKFLHEIVTSEKIAFQPSLKGQKIMVEYAHPNTHKEMHIGHMRTLITGEAIARLLASQGAEVFRANYQSDIGLHIGKALYGIEKMIEEEHLLLEEIEKWSNKDKAHFLGKGYARGSKDYTEAKEQIDAINAGIYKKEKTYWDLYQKTRQWSLDYYNEFYPRFYTKFDQLFFESDMVECGVKIVRDNIGKIFSEDNGAVIFKGEDYGLHTRVFITGAGNPTYEGKEMCNAFKEYEAFPFHKKIHIVGSEQAGYFQVVFKALELLDPEKFAGKQYHLPMGMVQLADRKISSRTGDVLRVDWLIDQVKEVAEKLFKEGKITVSEKDTVLEEITIGAIKYSVLKVGAKQNVSFDIEKSVSLDGDSGPYIQYAYARTQSILEKAGNRNYELGIRNYGLQDEELELLRMLYQFAEIVERAAENYAPNVVCNYLYHLARLFNLFYQMHRILNASTEEEKVFRIALTKATGLTLKEGLRILGIAAPEKM